MAMFSYWKSKLKEQYQNDRERIIAIIGILLLLLGILLSVKDEIVSSFQSMVLNQDKRVLGAAFLTILYYVVHFIGARESMLEDSCQNRRIINKYESMDDNIIAIMDEIKLRTIPSIIAETMRNQSSFIFGIVVFLILATSGEIENVEYITGILGITLLLYFLLIPFFLILSKQERSIIVWGSESMKRKKIENLYQLKNQGKL